MSLTEINKENVNDNNKEDPNIPNPNDIKFYPTLETYKNLTLYQYMMEKHPPSWSEFFKSAEKEIKHACDKIDEMTKETGKSIFPMMDKVLDAFWICPAFMLKVVIIGQDPYPGMTKFGTPKAIGCCFASEQNYPMPDSLKNVYKELERSVEDWENPGHPDIRCWGKQGVLLLNAGLTVEAGRPESHLGFWKPFTNKLLDYINKRCESVVFLLWGKKAERVANGIYTGKHKKLTAYHPSPQSANNGYYFVGCNHFNLTNIYLVEKGIEPIDWRIK